MNEPGIRDVGKPRPRIASERVKVTAINNTGYERCQRECEQNYSQRHDVSGNRRALSRQITAGVPSG